MAKKKRYDTRGKKQKKNSRQDDAANRITYLWGAAHLVAESSPSLSRFYTTTIKRIGRRINLSFDAETMKRQMCKKCSSLLVPGVGRTKMRQRLKAKRQSHVVVTCGHCQSVRRYVNHDAKAACREAPKEGVVGGGGSGGEGAAAAERTVAGCTAF